MAKVFKAYGLISKRLCSMVGVSFVSVAPVQHTVHKKFSAPALFTTDTCNHGLKAAAIENLGEVY